MYTHPCIPIYFFTQLSWKEACCIAFSFFELSKWLKKQSLKQSPGRTLNRIVPLAVVPLDFMKRQVLLDEDIRTTA